MAMSATRVTGIVPAGGASRRMGTDKRLLVVDGEPMLRRVVAAVAAVADEVIVVVAADRPADMAASILSLLERNDERARLSAAARRFVEESVSAASAARVFEQICQQALRGARKR